MVYVENIKKNKYNLFNDGIYRKILLIALCLGRRALDATRLFKY